MIVRVHILKSPPWDPFGCTDHVALAIYNSIPADYDDDGDCDLGDLSALQLCFSDAADAPGFATPSPECLDARDKAGGDGDIDCDDWLLLQSESATGSL